MRTTVSKLASSRVGKVLKWTALVVIALLTGITLWLNFGLAPTIRHTLETKVTSETAGKYELQIKRVGVNLLTSTVVFHHVQLQSAKGHPKNTKPDSLNNNTETNADQLSVTARSIRFRQLGWRSYLTDKKINLKGIYIESPDIIVTQDNRQPVPKQDQKQDQWNKLLDKLKNDLQIDEIVLSKGKVVHTTLHKKGEAQHSADNISIAFRDIRIDSLTKQQRDDPFPYVDKIEASLQHYRYLGADSVYELRINQLSLNADHSLRVQNLQFKPTLSDQALARLKQVQHDRFILKVPEISIQKFDVKKMLNKELIAQSIRIKNPMLNVYRDKRLPLRKDKRPLMPHEAMQKIPFRIQIDSTIVSGASISYTEQMPDAAKAGKVTFEKSSIQMTNLTNHPKRMNNRNPLVVNANTKLMNGALMTLTLTTNLLSPQLNCRYYGQLEQMQASDLNRISISSGNIRFKEGQVDLVTFSAQIIKGVATGTVKALYQNLKIEVIDPKQQKKHSMLTWLGNLVIKSRNEEQDKKSARVAAISYTRAPEDSFIYFLWQSLKTGLLASITSVDVEKVREEVQKVREKVTKKEPIQKPPPKAKPKKHINEK